MMKLDRIEAQGRIGLFRHAEGKARAKAARLPESDAKDAAATVAERYADEASRIEESEPGVAEPGGARSPE